MTVKFKTALCSIAKDKKPCYRAIVVHNGTVGQEAVAERIAAETGIDKALVRFYLEQFMDAVEDALASGLRVEVENLLRGMDSVKGLFPAPDAKWDSKRNSVVPRFSAKGDMYSAFAGADSKNVTESIKVAIKRVLDADLKLPDVLARGSKVLISGQGLKVDSSNTDEGVWFENDKGQVVVRGIVAKATDTTLDAVFPDWPEEDGFYKLCVASRGGNNAEYAAATAKRTVEVRTWEEEYDEDEEYGG